MDVFSVVTTAVVIDVVVIDIVVVVTAVVIDVVDVVTAVVIDVVVVTLRRGLGRSQFVYDLLRFQQTFRQRFDEL